MNKMKTLMKNKWFLLAVCLLAGKFGIHRFLMKRWISGILMLFLGLLGYGGLWMFIDCILIATKRLSTKEKRKTATSACSDV